MTGRGRWLRPNETTRVPKRVVCLDTESYESVKYGKTVYYSHSWRCGSATFDRLDNGLSVSHQEFSTERQEEFWAWVFKNIHKRERLWVFAHNLAFDLAISDIWGMARTGQVKIVRWIISDPPTIVDLVINGCKVRLCCLLNWWNNSVESLALALGTRREERPKDNASNRAWLGYCSQDVRIVREFMLSWIHAIKEYDLGNFKCTIAAQAMASYTHAFYTHRILAHGDKEFAAVERESYFGGRVFCGYVGNETGPLYHYDVNSLYPFIMSDEPFPTQPIHRVDCCSPDSLLHYMEKSAAVAEVMIRSDEWQYPKRVNKRVCYPIGRFRTVLCGEELLRALTHGQVLSVGRAMLYKREMIFGAWCEYWFMCMSEAKKRGDVVVSKICKYLCNSLSGKWGQRRFMWQAAPNIKPEAAYYHWHYRNHVTGERYECRSVAGCTQIKMPVEDETGGLVAISAHITSGGRVYMDSLRDLCGHGRVYYQDTDSLIMDGTALDSLDRKKLLSQTRVGALKKVGTLTNAQFDGPRRWQADGMRIHPGIRCDAEEIADGVYLQETCQGASGILAHDPQGIVRVTPRIMRQRAVAMGCVVLPTGDTAPMRIDE